MVRKRMNIGGRLKRGTEIKVQKKYTYYTTPTSYLPTPIRKGITVAGTNRYNLGGFLIMGRSWSRKSLSLLSELHKCTICG